MASGSKGDKIEVDGVIVKTLPGMLFDIRLSGDFEGMVVRAYVSGKMLKFKISLIEGDTVTVELTPYDLSKGRIVSRHRQQWAPQGPTTPRRRA